MIPLNANLVDGADSVSPVVMAEPIENPETVLVIYGKVVPSFVALQMVLESPGIAANDFWYEKMQVWVTSAIYPLLLALDFHEFFFSKKRYFFHDVATISALLYYCVVRCLNKEGYCTIRPAKCRIIPPLLQRIARLRNTRI